MSVKMDDIMNEIKAYAKSDKGVAAFPKLRAALKDLDLMIGLVNVKETVASQIMEVISYIQIHAPNRTSPPVTRQKTKEDRKRRRPKKRNWSRKKRRKEPSVGEKKEKRKMLKLEIQNELGAFLQQIEDMSDCDEDDECDEDDVRPKELRGIKLHSLLLGPSGCGKTTLAKKLHGVWKALGLVNDKFETITKGDLSSQFQGASLERLRTLIRECRGGVLFVDEAYSLVTNSKDHYGVELLNYITAQLTSERCTTTFVLAGYTKSMKSALLGSNEGLERRFASVFELDTPSTNDLAKIFKVLVERERGWQSRVDESELAAFFANHKDDFRNHGGDVETFVAFIRKAHIRRFFPERMSQRVTSGDVQAAFKMFKKNKITKSKVLNLAMYS